MTTPTRRWNSLAEALASAGSEEALVTAGRNGDIQGRITHHYRQAVPLPPEYWNGTLDYERARIRPCVHVEYGEGERLSIPGWVTVEIDLHSVRDHFGKSGKPANNTGGRPVEKDWEIALNAVWGMIYRGDTKPRIGQRGGQADIEKLLINWFRDQGLEVSESMARQHAKPILKELEKG